MGQEHWCEEASTTDATICAPIAHLTQGSKGSPENGCVLSPTLFIRQDQCWVNVRFVWNIPSKRRRHALLAGKVKLDWLRPENGNLPHPPTLPTIRGAARTGGFNVSDAFVFVTYSLLLKSVMMNHPRGVRDSPFCWPFPRISRKRSMSHRQPVDGATPHNCPAAKVYLVSQWRPHMQELCWLIFHNGQQQALQNGKQWHLGFCEGTFQMRKRVNPTLQENLFYSWYNT